ncbi:serine/threonine-protein kinase [Mycobacterium sp. NPDC051804]|uniref:serine/threonine-protein kinase n=1 Tax=Mycobacterium sp. NPDC051804 TaxID=3364295 RepID=UPI0037882C82
MDSQNTRVGQMFGHYRLTGLLGRGGMGEVYRADDTKKGRTVALKILGEQFWQDEKFRTRFQRESRAAAVLQEPHVIPIHDWGEIDGHPYIDMRLVEGQTLQDLLSSGPLPPARASFIIGGVAAALDAAHAAGLIHRDVKPQNVIVTPSDFPYLVDFGIAEAKGESGLTNTGMQIGTWTYMAPERFRDRDATPAVDVYALACVLFECLTGEPPFQANSIEQIMTSHLFMPPPQPSQANRTLSPAFDDVVARGMAKEPDDRYGSCGALGRATQRAVESDTTVRPVPAPTVQLPTQRAPAYPRPAGDFSNPTMQRPTNVAPRSYSPPPPSYTPPPTPSAPRPASSPPPVAASRKWLIPAVVGVVAVVALGGIGVVIGLLSDEDSKTVATEPDRPDPPVQQPGTDPDSKDPGPTSEPPPAEQPLGVGAPPPPPLVGPDNSANRTSCTGDYSLPGRNDPGTHARRGSADTSCLFTESVLQAYWRTFSDASRERRQVLAAGSVDCRTVLGDGTGCNGPNFVMECVARPGDAFITCKGGRDAVVYLF